MANTVIKYTSEQGSFSATKNIVDINIPSNSGVYDLSKSYLNFNITPDAVGSDAEAVYAVGVGFNESNRNGGVNEFLKPPTNAVIVKHCDISCQSKGRIEAIRNVACLRSNLAVYEKDKSHFKHDLGDFKSAITEQNFSKHGVNELYNEGTVLSRKRDAELRVNLKDLFGFGVVEEYDTQKYGNTRLHLECNFDKLYVDLSINNTRPWNKTNEQGNTDLLGEFANNATAVGAVDNDTVVTKLAYEDLSDSPFHTNQLLTFTFSDTAAGGGQTADCRITDITRNVDNKLVIVVTPKIKTIANGDTMTGISAVQKAPASTSLTINSIELVAYKRTDVSSGPNEIQFMAYDSQFDNFPESQTLNKQYFLPPNTLNAVVMFPNPIYSMEPVTSYRFSVNGEPSTNRDIEVKSGLHYDQLAKTFINMGSMVKNYSEKYENTNLEPSDNATQKDMRILALPIKASGNMTQLGLELNASGNMSGNVVIYSQVMKRV